MVVYWVVWSAVLTVVSLGYNSAVMMVALSGPELVATSAARLAALMAMNLAAMLAALVLFLQKEATS